MATKKQERETHEQEPHKKGKTQAGAKEGAREASTGGDRSRTGANRDGDKARGGGAKSRQGDKS